MATTTEKGAEAEKDDGIKWWSMRSKRSEAIPKTSLFGTSLEAVDRHQLNTIQGKYIPEGHIRPQTNYYPLPDHIKDNIPGRESLESSRKEVFQQRLLLEQVDEQLKHKAKQALAFSEDLHNFSVNSSQACTARPTWLSAQDLEHSSDINIVGLNKKGSYNRDKYGQKPRRHNYSLIGDMLATKMDLNISHRGGRDNHETGSRGRTVLYGRRRQHFTYDPVKDINYSKDKASSAKSLIDLPPNIRHMFGSRVCDTLLSDADKVSTALERRKAMSGPPRPSKKDDVKSVSVDFDGNYESLGATTRYNVFPGLTSGHTISRTQQEFNDEVHLRRVPNPDQFRYQRDELSIWVEQNVLRARMQKRWKEYYENLPKATANWDRNAKRPPKSMDMQPQKVERKPKPKKKVQDNNEKPEDEVIFVTPPLTPPPPEPEVVQVSSEFKRDDEFWSFFDQPLPK